MCNRTNMSTCRFTRLPCGMSASPPWSSLAYANGWLPPTCGSPTQKVRGCHPAERVLGCEAWCLSGVWVTEELVLGTGVHMKPTHKQHVPGSLKISFKFRRGV